MCQNLYSDQVEVTYPAKKTWTQVKVRKLQAQVFCSDEIKLMLSFLVKLMLTVR